MKMSNKLYNILKWSLFIFIPAVITLIGTLGQIYGFETEVVVLTISAITTFLGAVTGISNVNYHKEDYTSDTVGESYEEDGDVEED